MMGPRMGSALRSRRRDFFRPLVERLEDRRLLATFTVNSTADEGDAEPGDGKAEVSPNVTTLRAALEEANQLGGSHQIHFAVEGTGPHAIVLESALPIITAQVVIDGYTQPGAQINTNQLEKGSNAQLQVEVDGHLVSAGESGFVLTGGSSTVRGLAIHSFRSIPRASQQVLGVTVDRSGGQAIVLHAGDNNRIEGNLLGLTTTGSARANSAGVAVGSDNNIVADNVVVGSHNGVELGLLWNDVPVADVHGNHLEDNYIGVGPDGITAMPNRDGVLIALGAHTNTVFHNVVSSNSSVGISIVGTAPGNTAVGANTIIGNLIGTDKTGSTIDPDKQVASSDELGNKHAGIQIVDSPNNVIGGTAPHMTNVISGNGSGILITAERSTSQRILNNRIGTDKDGAKKLGNALHGVDIQSARNQVKQNVISGNLGSGVYISNVSAQENEISGNWIGTDGTGQNKLGNRSHGVVIETSQNIVKSNTISANRGIGVMLEGSQAAFNEILSNKIGTDSSGQSARGNQQAGVAIFGGTNNTIAQNTISGNKITGVLLWGPKTQANRIWGNRIGTNADGKQQVANTLDGVHIRDAGSNSIGGTNTEDRNIISGNTRDGIHITGEEAGGNFVQGNYIGISADSSKVLPNQGSGIHIRQGSKNTIGGSNAKARNVVSGNKGSGIWIEGTKARENRVQGNYIGTDKNGIGTAFGNQDHGISIDTAPENWIGGEVSQAGNAPGNIIAGNKKNGIYVFDPQAVNNRVYGNLIGRDKGQQPLPNNKNGIYVLHAQHTKIGEVEDKPSGSNTFANVIAGNKKDGVRVEGLARNTAIRRNAIYDNSRLGINLVGDEQKRIQKDHVTPNDWNDADDGANELMNFPAGVTGWFNGTHTIVSGLLATDHPENTVVDVYANATIHKTGFGEGQHYVGSVTPTKSGAFRLAIPGTLPQGKPFLSATATNRSGLGSTSEFSAVYGDSDTGHIDRDGDSLPDQWETEGIDFNGDGTVDLPLHQAPYSADPHRKNIFLEIDYMTGQKPDFGVINELEAAFLDAPVDNHAGIDLQVFVDEQLPQIPNLIYFGRGPNAADDFDDLKLGNPKNPFGTGVKDGHFGTRSERSLRDNSGTPAPASFRLAAKQLAFRYAVIGHTRDGSKSTGTGEPGGNDMFLTWGRLSHPIDDSKPVGPTNPTRYDANGGRRMVQSGSLMHEIGHTMMLGHGGPAPTEVVDLRHQPDADFNRNYKPNYLSVMNYSFIFGGVVVDRPLDYSRSILPILDERSLDESVGIQADAKTAALWPHTAYTLQLEPPSTVPATPKDCVKEVHVASLGGIDWNGKNGIEWTGPVKAAINDIDPQLPKGVCVVDYLLLEGAEDWNFLRFHFRASPFFADDVSRGAAATDGITTDHVDLMSTISDFDGDGFANANDNAPSVFNPDQLDADDDGIGNAAELVSLSLSSGEVAGGRQVTGTVTMLEAPPDGTRIRLANTNPELLSMPRFVDVPAGETSVAFTIAARPLVYDNTPVTVYATHDLDLIATELIVGPGVVDSDIGLQLTTSASTIEAGRPLTYTVIATNHGPAPVLDVNLHHQIPADAVWLSAGGVRFDTLSPGSGLNVRFDYRFDTSSFFDSPEKRHLLQLAAEAIVVGLGDQLEAIQPSGQNTWAATFPHPGTGDEVAIPDLVVDENELVVFVGARDHGSTGTAVNEGAVGGPGGFNLSGTPEFQNTVTTRGQYGADDARATDFGPWGGSISFNTNTDVKFHFDPTTGELDADELDFLTVAMHELMHVLGFGTADSWNTHVDQAQGIFQGPASNNEYDASGGVLLAVGAAHWQEGTTDEGEATLMDPFVPPGRRVLPTALDAAALDDIGWNTDGLWHRRVVLPAVYSEDSVHIDIGALNPGDSAIMEIEVLPTRPGTLVSRASLTSDYLNDLQPANNTALATTNIVPKSVIVVNATDDVDDGTADAAHTSLREAIQLANQLPGADTIHFSIPGVVPHTIQLQSPLPPITDVLELDGTSEPDFDGTPVVELDGSQAGPANGLVISAEGTTIRALAINRFTTDGTLHTGNGVVVNDSDANAITGCHIGTDVTGTIRHGNAGAGVLLMGASSNTIGGSMPGLGNLISANQRQGILMGPGSSSNVILGNLIGTDVTGSLPLGNSEVGVEIVDATDNLVGGIGDLSRNIISGNSIGVKVSGTRGPVIPKLNRIEGNYIGTNAQGNQALGNRIGVIVVDADHTFIGGNSSAAGNLISGNQQVGIQVIGYGVLGGISVPPELDEATKIRGNLIGTAADGKTALENGGAGILVSRDANVEIGGVEADQGNTIAHNAGPGVATSFGHNYLIRGNTMFANAGLGIDLYSDGVSPIYPATAAPWFYRPNYPVLTHAFTGGGSTTVEGTITGPQLPAQGVLRESVLDFYATASPDPSGHGEGAIYLGSFTTLPQGETPFRATLPVEVPDGYFITATGTRADPSAGAPPRTSEFSSAIAVSPDADGDRVLDSVEDAGPHGGDGNADGTLDSLQNHVVSLPNAADGSYTVLVSSAAPFRNVRSVANPSLHDNPPEVAFPIGFFEFTLLGNASTVSVFPATAVELETAYGYGSTSARPFDHWHQIASSQLEVFADHLEISFHDGQPGDNDRLTDGRIVTRFGPADVLVGAGTTIVVNSNNDVDDGVVDATHTSLREAIHRANFLAGKDRIHFEIPGTGPHTIRPLSALPVVSDELIIDGYTQPGSSPAANGTPAVILVELDGSLAGTPVMGLDIDAGRSTVRGLAVNRFGAGRYGWSGGMQIRIGGSGQSVVEGNYLGVDPSGTVAYGGPGQHDFQQTYGVAVFSDDNLIGGTQPAARNVVSGVAFNGIYVGGSTIGNHVQGNYVGSDATGTQALPNGTGILIATKASGAVIGGVDPGAGNLISGNADAGVALVADAIGVWENRIQGNLIGTDASGTTALGNGTGIGIFSGINNLIGGTMPEARNVISGNHGAGIWIAFVEDRSISNVIQGNLIGTDISGSAALGNAEDGILIEEGQKTLIGGAEPGAANRIAYNGQNGVAIARGFGNKILHNQIYANGRLGIDLGIDDVTANDPADGGPRSDFESRDLKVEFDGEYTTISLTVTGPANSNGEVWFHVRGPSAPIVTYWWQTDENGVAEVRMEYLRGRYEVERAEVRPADLIELANLYQNYPLLTSAVLGEQTVVGGTLDSTPDTSFQLDFFANSTADGSGYGEGQTYLGGYQGSTDGTGLIDFSAAFDTRVPVGQFITATATDPDGNTSEFSKAISVVAGSLDFGDSPTTFATELSANGARHIVVPDLYLGALVDAEPDGQPTPLANGDDTTSGDDEDGIRFLSPLIAGQTASLEVLAANPGLLSAWIDFNGDGSWDPDIERALADVALLRGTNTLFFDVPSSALPETQVFARFRLSTQAGLSFDGLALDGEVEDYLLSISAAEIDLPPIAEDDAATTTAQTPIVVNAIQNDFDPEGRLDVRSLRIVTAPAAGHAYVDRGRIIYTPASAFIGIDSLIYRIQDDQGHGDEARVTIDVIPGNLPPEAIDDLAETAEDQPVLIDVLKNDDDPENELVVSTVLVVRPPANGWTQVDLQTGAVTYVPYPEWSGVDRFAYRVADSAGIEDTAIVTVGVLPANDAPVPLDDDVFTLQDVPVTADVLGNDEDPDGAIDVQSMTIVEPPTFGSASIESLPGSLVYSPGAGFVGEDTLRYRICDAEGACGTATVIIDVGSSNQPPTARDDNVTIAGSESVQIDVAANDDDADGNLDPSSTTLLTSPRFGVVHIDEMTGLATYSPNDQFEQSDSFLYRIEDTTGAWDFAVVTIRSDVLLPASLSGYVYVDVNNNGLRDDQEMGLPNVPVRLEGPHSETVMTGEQGAYAFHGLPDGMYSVYETQPTAFMDGYDSYGSPRMGYGENDRFMQMRLEPGMKATEYNFGERGLKAELIGKYLFLASTPPLSELLKTLDIMGGQGWYAVRSPVDGHLTVGVEHPNMSPQIEIYDDGFRPLVIQSGDSEASTVVTRRSKYLVGIASSQEQQLLARLQWKPDQSGIYTNPVKPLDVSGDDAVTPIDALLVVNELNEFGAHVVSGSRVQPPYRDVNRDGLVTSLDALHVINELNRSVSEAEASLREDMYARTLSWREAAWPRPATPTGSPTFNVQTPASIAGSSPSWQIGELDAVDRILVADSGPAATSGQTPLLAALDQCFAELADAIDQTADWELLADW